MTKKLNIYAPIINAIVFDIETTQIKQSTLDKDKLDMEAYMILSL